MQRPWMPLYVSDFQMDTLDLKVDEVGVYMAMLCLAWHRDGPLPGDHKILKLMLQRCFSHFHGLTYNRIVPKLLERYFYRDDEGNWRQKRVEKELRIAREISENASRNAEKRWKNKALNKQNQEVNECDGNALAMPTQSQPHIDSYPLDKSKGLPNPRNSRKRKKERSDELAWKAVEAWESIGLSKIAGLTEARETSISRRANDLTACFGFEDPLVGFRELFRRVQQSPFLCGDNGRGWRANLDFVLKESNFTKIMEGFYENQQTHAGYNGHGYGRNNRG